MALGNLVSLFSRKKTSVKAAYGRKRLRPARRTLLSLESLEDRVVLSTITWVNPGNASSDIDGINAVFGVNAALARGVVAEAIQAWENVIDNFNYGGGDGGNEYLMTVNMEGSGTSLGASAGPTGQFNGKPTQGTATIGRGGDSGSDGLGDGVGWFLDATPQEHSEFAGAINNAFSAKAQETNSDTTLKNPAFGQSDLYTVLLHEFGHALGINSGVTYRATNTGAADTDGSSGNQTRDPAGTIVTTNPGFSWRFDGPSIQHLMTSYNSSDPPAADPTFTSGIDSGHVTHSAAAGQTVTANGVTYVGANDLMNPRYAGGERDLIPNTMALILKDAYGYSINLPERFGTYYTLLNQTTGQLQVRGGDGASNDKITISVNSSNLIVSVDLGNDVPGTGSLPGAGNLPAFVSMFPLGSVSSIVITPGAGNDTINIGDGELAFIPAISVLGAGGTIDLLVDDSATGGGDTYTVSGNSVQRSALFGGLTYNHIVANDVRSLTLLTETGQNTVNVTGTSTPTTIKGIGPSTVNIGNAVNGVQNINGTIDIANTLSKGTTLNVDDSFGPTGWNASLNINASSSGAFGDIAGLSARIGYNASALKALNISGSAFRNNFIVNGTGSGFTTALNSGAGRDTVAVRATGGPLIINGVNGSDDVTIGNATVGVQQVFGDVTVNNALGSTVLIVDNRPDGNIHSGVAISDVAITGLVRLAPSAAINYQQSQLTSLTVFGGDGGNTFDISNFSRRSGFTLVGGIQSDRIVSTNDADFTLTDNVLSRTRSNESPPIAEFVELASIETATLTGGASANSFTLRNWNGQATLNGAGGANELILKHGSFATNANYTITESRIDYQRNSISSGVAYSNFAGLSVQGGPGSNTFTSQVDPFGPLTSLTIDGGSDTNTFYAYLLATVNNFRITVNAGSAADMIHAFYQDTPFSSTGTLLSVNGHGGTLVLHGESTQDTDDGDNGMLTNQVGFTVTNQTVTRENTSYETQQQLAFPDEFPQGSVPPVIIARNSQTTTYENLGNLVIRGGQSGSNAQAVQIPRPNGGFFLRPLLSGNRFDVQSTPAAATVTVVVGTGDDRISMGPNTSVTVTGSRGLDLIGEVAVTGTGGNVSLRIDDQQGTGMPADEFVPATATNVQTSVVEYAVTGQDVIRTAGFGFALPGGVGGGGAFLSSISYQGITTLELNGSTVGGAKPLSGSIAGDFDTTLSLTGFAATTLDVAGDFRGSLLASTIGTLAAPIEHIHIGGSLLGGSLIRVDYLDTLFVGGDFFGTVEGCGDVADPNTEFTIGAVTVEGQLWGASGSITAPSIKSINTKTDLSVFAGKATEIKPGADFQFVNLAGSMASTGTITAGMIVSMTVGTDLAGQVLVAGDLGTLTVGGDLTGTVVAGSIGTLIVGGSITGTVATTTNSSAIVNGTDGDDVFLITPTGVIRNGTTILSGAWTTLTVNGRGGIDSLTVDDQATSTGSYYAITGTTVGRAVEAVPQSSFANTITYGTIENLAVKAGGAKDWIDVQSTAAGTTTLVDSGSGDDTVTIGPNLDAIGQITVIGNAGVNTLKVNDEQGTGLPANLPANSTVVQRSLSYTVSDQMVSRGASYGYVTPDGGGGGSSYREISYQGMARLELNTSHAGSVIDVQNTAAVTTIGAGSGDDVVNVGSLANNLDGLRGLLTVNGANNATVLNINDQGATVGKTYHVTAGQVSRASLQQPSLITERIAYSAIGSLVLRGGGGSDVFNLESILSGGMATVWSGGGSDAFIVSPVAQNLDNLQGTLVLHGAGPAPLAASGLTVNDQTNLGSATWTRTPNRIVRARFNGVQQLSTQIDFDNMEPVIINGGRGASTLIGAVPAVNDPKTTLVAPLGSTGFDSAEAIATDSAGNIYVTGHFHGTVDFNTGPGVFNLTSTGNQDMFVTKYSPANVLVWARSFGGSGTDETFSNAIKLDGSGNVYVSGSFTGRATFAGAVLTSLGSDMFVTKLASTGNVAWAISGGGSLDDYAYGLAVDNSGNCFITGSFQGTAIFGKDRLVSEGPSDAFVTKISRDGAFRWARQFGGSGDDGGGGIALDAAGDIYTTGSFFGNATFGQKRLSSFGDFDSYVAKLTSDGVVKWASRFGGSGNDFGSSIAVDSSGNLYATGLFFDAATFGSTPLSSPGGYDSYITRINVNNGNVQWSKSCGGEFDFVHSLATDGAGNVYATGSFVGTASFGGASLTSVGGHDVFVTKLSSAGAFQWTRRLGGAGHDLGNGIAVDGAGHVYVAGTFSNAADFDADPSGVFNLTSVADYDAFIIQLTAAAPLAINGLASGGLGNNVLGLSTAGLDPKSGLGAIASKPAVDSIPDSFLVHAYADDGTQFADIVAKREMNLAALDLVFAEEASSRSYNGRFGAVQTSVGPNGRYWLDLISLDDDLSTAL